jgi:gamma-glutamyltranspeptidase/glutathione hydrolase
MRVVRVVWLGVALAACVACRVNAPPAQATDAVPLGPFPAHPRELYESYGRAFMVVTQGDASTRAARRMFELGGNVVDAAAAASFALAVERPQSTGIAGGGFMMLRLTGERDVLAVDFRETAPAKASRDMYLDGEGNAILGRSTNGIFASGVPGMVAGVLEVHEKFGKLDRATILAPAIALAEDGFDVYPHLASAIKQRADVLRRSPEALTIFFAGRETPLAVGDRIRQPGLAKVLREIARKGRDGFYKGWVARALLAEQKRQGGLITAEDLAGYQVKFREPVHGEYGPYTVFSMPPPSSGGIHVIEILNILEGYSGEALDPYGPTALHRTASAMAMAFFDRARYLGDPDFVRVPVAALTSQRYADDWRRRIPPQTAVHLTPTDVPDAFRYESPETTHFTIADAEGNVVSSTQTVNGWLGSGVVVRGAGFVLNNEMDDFSVKPGVPNMYGVVGSEENAVAARKRPLSSMSPTLVLRDGAPILALGSPSGSQIITCVTLSLMNYLSYRMPLWESVAALRYHHQWTPDKLLVEAPGLPADTTRALRAMGHDVVMGGIGCKVEAIAYEDGRLHGVADPRGEGLAAGEGPIAEPARITPTQPQAIPQD